MIDAVRMWLAGVAPERPHPAGAIAVSLYRNSPKAAIVLTDEHGLPCALVKVARDAEAEPGLQAEHAALLRLASHASTWVRSQAPMPIALGRVAGRLVMAQSFVDGRPMTARYYKPGHTRSRRRVERDFALAASWLDRFVRETAAGGSTFDHDAIDRLVRAPIARYRHEIGWSTPEEDLFNETIERAEGFRGATIPIAATHGDFWMANILGGTKGINGVVDWEHAELDGVPATDLYKFPTSYGGNLNRASPRAGRVHGHPGWTEARSRWEAYGTWSNIAGIAYAFFGKGWFPSLVRSWIEDRGAGIGLDPAMHAIFFPVFLAQQAMTLKDPEFRDGYRATVIGVCIERGNTWLWHDPSTRRTSAISR